MHDLDTSESSDNRSMLVHDVLGHQKLGQVSSTEANGQVFWKRCCRDLERFRGDCDSRCFGCWLRCCNDNCARPYLDVSSHQNIYIVVERFKNRAHLPAEVYKQPVWVTHATSGCRLDEAATVTHWTESGSNFDCRVFPAMYAYVYFVDQLRISIPSSQYS